MRKSLGDKERLLHIVDAIEEIESYVQGINEAEFAGNSMMVHATIKQLEIIGEACNRISIETRNKNEEIDWKRIIGLRNILIHEYFGVDRNLVWQIITFDVPDLKAQIRKLLS